MLKGVRIVDLSMGWAGQLSTRNLADLGATVIKVESCTNFDWWRSWEATQEWIDDDGAEKALPFLYVNRNKLDITLDLESKEGRELLLKLVASTDAVVENFSGLKVWCHQNKKRHFLIWVNREFILEKESTVFIHMEP